MRRQIFSLLTDFGTSDSYVAQMKGVLLSRCPNCTLADISHQIPPQDVRKASQIIAEVVPQFPAGTVHLVVVDPGVGTQRSILAVEAAEQCLVLPDNGSLINQVMLLDVHSEARKESSATWSSEVISQDGFGNVILASSEELLACLPVGAEIELRIGEHVHSNVPVVETYGEAYPGNLVLLRDSQNRLELALVNGSAARTLGLQPHGSVKISLESRL